MERRSFSKYEQETIKTIVENVKFSVDYLLVNIYNDIFYYTNVEYVDNELHFYYKKEDFEKIDDKIILSIKKDVIVKTLLLMYLIDNRYIYLVDQANVQGQNNNIQLANKLDTQYELTVDLPKDIAEFLNNCKRVVIISQELITLVENNFKSFGEQQVDESKEQTKNSRCAMYASIGTLIIAIFTPFLVSVFSGENKYHEDILDSIQQTTFTLEKSTAEVNVKMDSLAEIGIGLQNQDIDILHSLRNQESTLKNIKRIITHKDNNK